VSRSRPAPAPRRRPRPSQRSPATAPAARGVACWSARAPPSARPRPVAARRVRVDERGGAARARRCRARRAAWQRVFHQRRAGPAGATGRRVRANGPRADGRRAARPRREGRGAVRARAGARGLRRAHAEAARPDRRRDRAGRARDGRRAVALCHRRRRRRVAGLSPASPLRADPPRPRDRRTVWHRLRRGPLGPVDRAQSRRQGRPVRRGQPAGVARDATEPQGPAGGVGGQEPADRVERGEESGLHPAQRSGKHPRLVLRSV
jgi:hypothetical protein